MTDQYLDSIEHAEILLGRMPNRQSLAHIKPLPTTHHYRIRIVRTMPFEWIGQLLPPFCQFWQAAVHVDYSSYDTSLAQLQGHERYDAYILWLDWRLYQETMTANEAVHWIQERILALRKQAAAPILINNWFEHWNIAEGLFSPVLGSRGWVRTLNEQLAKLADGITGCEIIDLAGCQLRGGEPIYDERNDQMSHFPLTNRAATSIARHVALHLLPAMFKPRIKAIVLDLDDTLYRGVLGEDGSDGVELTDGHALLHQLLLQLQRSGVLLTICSRNEIQDVRQLFEHRAQDFPLQWQDFASVQANWQPKSHNIAAISAALNILPSDFLFIDDNVAELLKVAAIHHDIRLLKASIDGGTTAQMLSHYPGLYQFKLTESDHLRTADIQANEDREQLKAQTADQHTYLAALKMVITISTNDPSHRQRLYELSQKTNQFNLALQRFNMIDIEQMADDAHFILYTISLRDSLSDSGVIGSIIVQTDDKAAVMRELAFSCRALGRDVETVAFAHVLKSLLTRHIRTLDIETKTGPRNSPALQWLHTLTGGSNEQLDIALLHDRVAQVCVDHPATIESKIMEVTDD